MKQTRLLLLIPVVAALGFSGCGDDEKPKTLPTVTTEAVTNITTTTATAGGEITDDGNAKITEAGVVYSSASDEPTILDNKIEADGSDESFSISLEGLSSGTTYHVRAYATNSKGTAYGEVMDFVTGNAAPLATNVNFTGDLEANKTLTATYTYNDAESNPESGTTFQWYSANDATGTGLAAIEGATESTYLIAETLQDKYISVGVTPRSSAGTTTGTEVKSIYKGGVGEATTVPFQGITYGIKISDKTGRKWLDRNLGAPNKPTSSTDFANYGNLYQWGRLADGHQIIQRTGPADADMTAVSGTTAVLSNSDTPPDSKLILYNGANADISFWDWRVPQNDNLWQGVTGINNPCPAGWRIPTKAEWAAEQITSSADGYTKLNLTLTGKWFGGDGNFYFSTSRAYYWASDIAADPWGGNRLATAIKLVADYAEISVSRGEALGCRCIKD